MKPWLVENCKWINYVLDILENPSTMGPHLTGPDPANCGWTVISGRWLMSRAFLALVLLGIRQGQTGNGPYTVHTISQKCQAC